MNHYGLQLHKFILGELRTDGWESDWKKDLKRRMAEDSLKPRLIVKTSQIVKVPKVRQERPKREPRGPQKPRAKRIERPSKWGIPNGSSTKEYRRAAREMWRAAGRCGACGKPTIGGRYSCVDCLERKARYYCKKAKKEYVAKTIAPRFCMECKTILSANNVYGFCNAHYKQKRHYLKRAA